MAQLQDHISIIISECDMLEDIFSDRSEVMTAINVIRNAAHRIARTINGQSQSASEMFAENAPTPAQTALSTG